MHHDSTPETLSERFLDHMRNPRNQGDMERPSGAAEMTGQCGDSIGVSIHVADGRIRDIRVQPTGCAFTLVCASAMSVLAHGKSLDDALTIETEHVVAEVGGLPEDHLHCARLALNTLGEAIADHLEKSGKGPGPGKVAAAG